MRVCGEGGEGVSVVGGLSECWPTSVGSSWDPADTWFREDPLPRCAVRQLHRLFPGCVSECECECVCVRVCVCCCSSTLVRTTLSFGPWGVRTFLSSHASKFDSVLWLKTVPVLSVFCFSLLGCLS